MIRVLHVCAEVFPLLKTGGLADVTGALPAALQQLDCQARIVVPGFPAFAQGLIRQHLITELPAMFGAERVRLVLGVLSGNGIPVYMIDAPGLYDRPGNPYADASGQAYEDNDRRFALLSWVAVRLASGADPSWRPQVLHGHDWHAGLMPAYVRQAEWASGHKPAQTVLTVHNLAYQGVFPAHRFDGLGLPGNFFDMHGMEFHGQVSLLKAGLFYADKITTVSPSYAQEIQQPEQGCGLDGLLRSRSHDLHGILNGVDPAVWNPATDTALAATYDSSDLQGKHACKAALQQEAGLRVQDKAPLFGIVTRLAEQKGLHLILAGLPALLERGAQLVLLGSGEPALEAAFRAVAAQQPESVAVRIGYDEAYAHRIMAGADVILVPSRYEPCGLTQLYGLRYGTLPLVRRVGGLADSVVDTSLENLDDDRATGFVFDAFDPEDYSRAVRRAFALYARPPDWHQVQRCAMVQDFGWDRSAHQYLALYRSLLSA